jgi:sec-independent protein translocase protein TatB
MFDIGFSEILVIAVVALIVIGPERLPGVARTLGHLFGRMQRYVNDVKADIQREIELDELKKLRKDVEESARDIQDSLTKEVSAAEQEIRGLESLANSAVESGAQSAQPTVTHVTPNETSPLSEFPPATTTPKTS